jgi:hypothetical protein
MLHVGEQLLSLAERLQDPDLLLPGPTSNRAWGAPFSLTSAGRQEDNTRRRET